MPALPQMRRAVLPSPAPAYTRLPQQGALVARWSADAIPPQADNSMLAGWTDAVGGITAAQATTAAQPRYRTGGAAGKPYVLFSGAQFLDAGSGHAAASAIGTVNNTIFLFYRNPQPTANGFILATHATSGNYHLCDDGKATGRKAGLWAGAGGPGRVDLTGASGMISQCATGGRPTDSGNYRNFVNGTCPGMFGGGGSMASAAPRLQIGGWAANPASFGFSGEVYEVLVWNRILTAPEVMQVEMWARDKYALPYPWKGAPFRIFHGDSIQSGAFCSAPDKSAPARAAAANGWSYGQWTNLGHTGWTWTSGGSNLNAEAALDVDPLLALLGSTPAHLMAWEYFNQAKTIAPASASFVIGGATTYLTARRAAGWSGTNRIAFGTSTDATDGAAQYNEATRTAYNAWWDTAANRAGLMDAYLPFHLDTRIGTAAACANAAPYTPYFHTDGIHMIDAGYQVLGGELMAPAMAGL